MIKRDYLTKFDVPKLKNENIKLQKELDEKLIIINKNMSDLSSKRIIPREVMERYEKNFGVFKTKKAFKFFFFSFLFVLIMLLFFKPSLFSTYSSGFINVKNFSSTQVSGIDIVYLDGVKLEKVSTINSIDSLSEKKIRILNSGVYFVFSNRQLPFVVVVWGSQKGY